MSDQRSFRGWLVLPALPLGALRRAASFQRLSARPLVWALIGAAAVGVGTYFWLWEGGGAEAAFATAVTLAIGAVLALATRRVLMPGLVVLALLFAIRTVSAAKRDTSEVLLHAYDLVAVLQAPQRLIDAWQAHGSVVLTLAALVGAVVLAAVILRRIDVVSVRRMHAAAAAVVFAGAASLADGLREERRHTEFFFEVAYVTSFYASWAETVRALWRGHLIEADAAAAGRLDATVPCAPAGRLPHIVLIHQESVVPPAHFPALSYDRGLDSLFQSADGTQHKLRVETYGGASWLTEFSLLTGLSTRSFGGMRQMLQPVLAGKVADTLPQALARCGYRNVMFYPMLRHFLGAGRFFEAAGIGEIFDAKAQGAQSANERDRFYYANALAEIGRHVKDSSRPLFLYIQTMSAHGAYDYTYMPEVAVPGGGPGTHPEMSEYLRRLAMAGSDYAHLRAELARRFPRQQFLIVHYGDHHPTATQTLLGFDASASIEDVVASGKDAAFTTYYALDAVRYRLPPLPSFETLDVAYLGTLLQEAAGVPLSDSHRERRRLMLLCRGRYYDCPAREEVLRFHRRMIDSGLLKAL